MATARSSTPRSLAEDLRARSDAELVSLLRARPDLAVPWPTELGTVAARAAGRGSAQRAVDGLDAAGLQVLEVMAALGEEPVSATLVSRRWGADARPVLAGLRERALVWGPSRALHLVRAAREALGPYPAGLGPPLREALTRRSPQRIAELAADLGLPASGDPESTLEALSRHLGDPDVVSGLLDSAPDGTRAVLDRLAWGPPVGQLAEADRPVRSATAATPVEWLLAHALLAVSDPGHVVLPREVALVLRGGRVHRVPASAPPALTGTPVAERLVASASVGAAGDLVRHVEHLGRTWGDDAPPQLRSGGLGIRELRRAAQLLGVEEPVAAVVVELAQQAGLVAEDGEVDARWAPTARFPAWRDRSTGERWAALAAAWLSSDRATWLIGTRDARDAVRTPLTRDLERPGLAELRRRIIAELALAGPARSVEISDLLARLDWFAPRQSGSGRHAAVRALLDEAAILGLTGAGALSDLGLAVTPGGTAGTPTGEPVAENRLDPAADDVGAAAARAGALLDRALPPPVDHVLVQADLTAVAPGPLVREVADELDLLADVESRGAATVYRFTASSVRRAFDAGRTGEEVLGFLDRHSRTPLPQPLRYLVEEVAQRFARVRVGSAAAFVRAEDPALLNEVMADRRAAGLRLRRLAPTVIAAQAPPEEVLRVLREAGLAPAAESTTGDLLLRAAGNPRFRAPDRGLAQVRGTPVLPDRADLEGLVRSLRAADVAASAGRPGTGDPGGRSGSAADGSPGGSPGAQDGRPPVMRPASPGAVLEQVRNAARDRAPVWISYVEGEGRRTHRLVEPLVIEQGRMSARDVRSRDVMVVPVHRIIAVAAHDRTP